MVLGFGQGVSKLVLGFGQGDRRTGELKIHEMGKGKYERFFFRKKKKLVLVGIGTFLDLLRGGTVKKKSLFIFNNECVVNLLLFVHHFF